ncbi:polysaccharide deacetylase family protein [Aureibacter tunicatorum]|uniref:Peptidoglycan/xylan/chitin deacetylase (PgdA/CDA1 family) n=1 Tax=Aureibacter tunicatorum TaxID=866807 RepID=A0AAE3XLA3_9BACT|nr:polysaccharide deacetylase family protein [Aureibacter tunicatorum]MDR6237856.1 peptidoglycan/xylan/chitin deacetylase (PgdA/CDA1 family) [Aureibacter tunicatorum]BDD02891.1 hypothetical protein AUTU_03740 [Aureibacter tunicatorum]
MTLNNELLILMYHQIDKPKADAKIKGLFTKPSQFEWQIKLLQKNGANFTTFEEIEEKGMDPERKNVILTFDDGSDCFIKNAFPILNKYKAKSVVYPVFNAIGEKNVVFEESTNKSTIDLLTNEELIQLNNDGVEIGSHCLNHVHLAEKNEETVLTELIDSKKGLEEIIGKEIVSIAYPFGSYNEKVLDLAHQAGYTWAVSTNPGSNIKKNKLELSRAAVRGYKLSHYFKFWRMAKRELAEA